MSLIQFTTLKESNFSEGLDQESVESEIKPGYVEDLLNMNPSPTGSLRTRSGYQGRAGDLPVRVSSITYSDDATNNILVNLPTPISLPAGRSQPLVIFGRTSALNTANVGDFPNNADEAHYYTGFSPNLTHIIPVGTGTINIPLTTHGVNSPYLLVNIFNSTVPTDYSNELVNFTSVQVNHSTKNIAIGYTNSSGSPLSVYICPTDNATVASVSYVGSLTGSTLTESILTGTNTYNLTQAVHTMSPTQVIVECWEDTGTVFNRFTPDSVTINSVTNDISFVITNNTGSAFNAQFAVREMPLLAIGTGSVAAQSTGTITFSGAASPFHMVQVWKEVTIGGNRELVIPDSIIYDDTTTTVTITLQNTTLLGASFFAYYDDLMVSANSLILSGEVIATINEFTDTAPQLTIWGLLQEELYAGDTAQRAGWTTYLDSYRTLGDNRLVAGLGGNIFAERSISEVGTTYLLPSAFPNLVARINADTIIGPVFWGTGVVPARTRGTIAGTDGDDNTFNATTFAYNSGTGYVDITISIPAMAVVGSPISTTSGLEDWVTITQSGYAVNTGTFKIKTVTYPTASTMKLSVVNSDVTSTDFNETGSGASAGIYTDQLTFSSASPFVSGDTLISELFPTSTLYEALSSVGSVMVLNNLTDLSFSLPAGLRILANRTSSVIPIRPSVVDFVRGDMVSYSPNERLMRVLNVNTNGNISVSIAAAAGTATVTLGSLDTTFLSIGMKILFTGMPTYAGAQTVTAITSPTTFTFDTDSTTSESGTLIGNTITVDEELEWFDTATNENAISVPSRWIPIEIPQDNFNLTPKTLSQTLNSEDYDNQSTLRSVITSDTLFLTNGTHEVMKFDGTSIYRSGLPRWNANLFSTVDPNNTAKIVVSNPAVVFDSVPASSNQFIFTTTPDGAHRFVIGDIIQDAQDLARYSVTGIQVNTDSTGASIKGILSVDRAITGSSGTKSVSRISEFKYYVRLNAVDLNGNVVISAIAASSDMTVSLAVNAAVRLRIVGPPALDLYDYDRLEVQIYRTKANSVAPYYLLTDLPLNFDTAKGYVDFIDTASDFDLVTQDFVNTALKGANLGTGFSDPLRAKVVTTAANRLILGNLLGQPTLDIKLFSTNTIITQSILCASANKRFLFRKDSTDTATTTNMVSRFATEFVNTGAVKIRNSSSTFTFVDADVNTGTDIITHATHGLSTGDAITLSNSGGALPVPLAAATVYYVITASANTFKLATTAANAQAGTQIDITSAAGGGTNTLTPISAIASGSGLFVVSSISHGLAAGDWIYLFHSSTSGTRLLTWAGWHQIASVTTHTFTINTDYSSTAASINDVDSYVTATAQEDIPVWLGTDGNTDVILANPTSIQPDEFQAMIRMSKAINSAMRKTDRTITAQAAFVPWVMANAGNDYSSGQIVLTQPTIFDTDMSVKLPALSGDFSVFVGAIKQVGSANVGAQTKVYPSRLIVSYPNFPEIFDSPEAASELDSDSIIDVNSADGQEITAILPFFGDAAFGAAQKSGIVVVFKTYSIYIVDLNAKAQGLNPLQRLDTRGIGCTAPFSPAPSRSGIAFVNETGLYRINTSLTLDLIGRKYRRKWLEHLNTSQIGLSAGHNDTESSSYKVSYPIDEETENSLVAVYSHLNEDSIRNGTYSTGIGAWGTYDAHPAVLYCTLGGTSFFASTTGRVFSIRQVGDETDCRDDNQAISQMALLRALDGGDAGRRKVWGGVTTHFRNPLVQTDAVTLTAASNLHTSFDATDTFVLKSITPARDGIGDQSAAKGASVTSTLANRNGVYLQLKYTLNEKDTPIEISGVDIRAGVKGDRGMTNAAGTSRAEG